MANILPHITSAELNILKVLWTTGAGTVRDVKDELARSGDVPAYTTVMTMMNQLAAKGALEVDPAGKALARCVRGREESRQPDCRDPRSARRRRHTSAIRPDCASVRLRVSKRGCRGARETQADNAHRFRGRREPHHRCRRDTPGA